MTELDLHADSERWSDNRDDETCPECGGPRVITVPAWADGSGVLTVEEIAEVLGKARLRVLGLADDTQNEQAEYEGGLIPSSGLLPDDIVMQIDGRADGTFRARILAKGAIKNQTKVRSGVGSSYEGAQAWRQAFRRSRYCYEDTTPEEEAAGLLAYEGPPRLLNFATRYFSTQNTPEAKEILRLTRLTEDRVRRETAWQRTKNSRSQSQPPEGETGTG